MNSEQLHYFELAYKERSFSAAARRVPCTPQGLTKTVRNLERELDVPLFVIDEGTGLPAPTEYAHELYEFACVYDSNMRLLNASFDRIRGKEEQVIRLGCSLGAIGTTGPWYIRGFHEAHPHVTVAYREGSDAQCDADLANEECGIALTVTPPSSGNHATPLFRSTWCFWVRHDDPLAKRDVITFDDLVGRDVALPGKGFRCYDRLRRETEERGVSVGDIFEMSELFQIFEFAASGQGLGFCVSHLTGLAAFRSPAVKVLHMPTVIWGFDIVRRETRALTEAEKLFWGWSVEFCRTIPGNLLEKLSDPYALTVPPVLQVEDAKAANA